MVRDKLNEPLGHLQITPAMSSLNSITHIHTHLVQLRSRLSNPIQASVRNSSSIAKGCPGRDEEFFVAFFLHWKFASENLLISTEAHQYVKDSAEKAVFGVEVVNPRAPAVGVIAKVFRFPQAGEPHRLLFEASHHAGPYAHVEIVVCVALEEGAYS